MRHKWYEYSIHDVVYRSNDNGPYQLWADSIHLNPCIDARYTFQANSTLTFTNACFTIPIKYQGTWNIDDTNQLNALVSDLNNGQLYYFGLVGKITEIDDTHFDVRSTKSFSAWACAWPSPCVFIKDSIITTVRCKY